MKSYWTNWLSAKATKTKKKKNCPHVIPNKRENHFQCKWNEDVNRFSFFSVDPKKMQKVKKLSIINESTANCLFIFFLFPHTINVNHLLFSINLKIPFQFTNWIRVTLKFSNFLQIIIRSYTYHTNGESIFLCPGVCIRYKMESKSNEKKFFALWHLFIELFFNWYTLGTRTHNYVTLFFLFLFWIL